MGSKPGPCISTLGQAPTVRFPSFLSPFFCPTTCAACIAAAAAASSTLQQAVRASLVDYEWFCLLPHSLRLSLAPVLQVTLSSTGGHSSMPPTDGSSIGDRLARFLSAMCANPGPNELVAPTSDFVAGLGRLAPGEGRSTGCVFCLGLGMQSCVLRGAAAGGFEGWGLGLGFRVAALTGYLRSSSCCMPH